MSLFRVPTRFSRSRRKRSHRFAVRGKRLGPPSARLLNRFLDTPNHIRVEPLCFHSEPPVTANVTEDYRIAFVVCQRHADRELDVLIVLHRRHFPVSVSPRLQVPACSEHHHSDLLASVRSLLSSLSPFVVRASSASPSVNQTLSQRPQRVQVTPLK